jgi:hypothetical protein
MNSSTNAAAILKSGIYLVYEKYVILAMRIASRNQNILKNYEFRIFGLKNCQEMWVLRIYEFYEISVARTVMRIRMNQVVNTHMRFHREHQKILGSVRYWKFIRVSCSERHFSGYGRLPKNFGITPPPAAIFASPIDTEKLIKTEGLFLVNLPRTSIHNRKGYCAFQLPLVYNRVCWGSVWCCFGLFSFEKWAAGP